MFFKRKTPAPDQLALQVTSLKLENMTLTARLEAYRTVLSQWSQVHKGDDTWVRNAESLAMRRKV
jgi:hypothetical protein